jgi:hypothetical protein
MTTQAPAIAAAFAALLYRDLSPVEWAEMRVRNITADAGVCASHDHLDANMTMAEAFESLGIPTALDHEDGTAAHEAACALWGAAWNIAKAEYLTERATLDDLTEELAAYQAREGMEPQCAEEALAEDITAEQRTWLSRFVARWEALEDAADLAATVRAHGGQ